MPYMLKDGLSPSDIGVRLVFKGIFLPSGVVHRESGEHQPAAQPRHRERAHQEGLPADRAVGQGAAGGEPQLPAASDAVETVHVPGQEGRQEERGACSSAGTTHGAFPKSNSSIW